MEKPSPISSSWQEVGEGDLEIEGEDHLMEEEDTHLLKCRLGGARETDLCLSMHVLIRILAVLINLWVSYHKLNRNNNTSRCLKVMGA